MSGAIAEGSRVRLHFAIKLSEAEVIDSNFGGQAACLQIGDGSLPQGFERHLLGLAGGDHRLVNVAAADAFGPHNPANVQWLPRSRFAGMTLDAGLVVMLQGADGGQIPAVVLQTAGERVQLDFNHPLAGRDLVFEVQIVDVQPG